MNTAECIFLNTSINCTLEASWFEVLGWFYAFHLSAYVSGIHLSATESWF